MSRALRYEDVVEWGEGSARQRGSVSEVWGALARVERYDACTFVEVPTADLRLIPRCRAPHPREYIRCHHDAGHAGSHYGHDQMGHDTSWTDADYRRESKRLAAIADRIERATIERRRDPNKPHVAAEREEDEGGGETR